MNKKMRELLAKIESKQALVKGYTDGENKDLEKAKELLDEIEKLQEEYQVEKRLFENEKKVAKLNEEDIEEIEKNIANKKEDNKEIKNIAKGLNEGTPADGGYTVPEDISTLVEQRREAKASLIDLVSVEIVSTNKGSRTFKKRSQQTGFTKVGEGGKITKTSTPQFERMDFEISKYAGYLPITNELLEDTDTNIVNTIVEWLGDESRVTRNKIILDLIKTQDEQELNGLDDIKKTLNVTLGSAFKSTSVIVTNDDGLQYLDTLKDNEGNYILQPNPAEPMQLRLCAGATTVPVKVIPNADLPTSSNKIPFIIGDLKEGIRFFDRKSLTLNTSNVAAIGELNAFEEDLTLFRGIEREDCKIRDNKAFVNGYISTTPSV
jgi:HK97 family phage major capsid protein